MMNLLSLLKDRVDDSWRFLPGRYPCLDKLPNDILIEIISYLDVEDILSLRRTNIFYFVLTHEACIWKSLLPRIGPRVPLPPFPPSFRYSLKNLSSLETERLITRALSLNKIWNNDAVDYCPNHDVWSFSAHRRVLSMFLLPGSQYLVASVADRLLQRCSILIFTMDHKYGGAVPLVMFPTVTKAFGLQAKYMTVGGVDGIVISYITRHWQNARDGALGININEYSGEHEVDPPYPIFFRCETRFVSLHMLQTLADCKYPPGHPDFIKHARKLPEPSRILCQIDSPHSMGPICLGEVYCSPYVAVVIHPNTISFKQFNGGGQVAMQCKEVSGNENKPHKILSIRIFPEQNELLVLRNVKQGWPVELEDHLAMEQYLIPINLTDDPLTQTCAARDRLWIPHRYQIEKAYISDHYSLTAYDASVFSEMYRDVYRERPITMFFVTRKDPEKGTTMLRLTMYPKKAPADWLPPTPASSPMRTMFVTNHAPRKGLKDIFIYDIRNMGRARTTLVPPRCGIKLIPAATKPIVQVVDPNDITECPRIIRMYRWLHPDANRAQPSTFEEDEAWLRSNPRTLATIGFEMGTMNRLACVAWDETIGRLCMVGQDGENVEVVDFGSTRRLDFRDERVPIEIVRETNPDALPYYYGGTQFSTDDPLLGYVNSNVGREFGRSPAAGPSSRAGPSSLRPGGSSSRIV